MPDQGFRDRLRVGTVPLHPQRKGFHTAGGQPGIQWAGHRSGSELHEADAFGQLVVVQHKCATEHIRMTTKVLSGGVHDGIRTECERIL